MMNKNIVASGRKADEPHGTDHAPLFLSNFISHPTFFVFWAEF
jgi:hypothetical protein